MKKSILLVVLFLMGMTTQTFSQRNRNVNHNPGNYDRYYNTHEIRFVENGVLYSVAVDGSFNFRQMYRPYNSNRGRRNFNTVYYNSAPGAVTYINTRPVEHYRVRYGRYGRIKSIGPTLIRYRRDGRVKSIGCVAMTYYRGSLSTVGNLQILYNRRGKIRNTIGHVNRYNKKFWHDDWYRYNRDRDDDDWDDDDWEDDRERRRKK
ncbi:MAG: hypothetical protein KJO39_02950 [Bacteroidia bacterium]|nr:hypothetical protein [Bacteroidia bacterium]